MVHKNRAVLKELINRIIYMERVSCLYARIVSVLIVVYGDDSHLYSV